MKTRLSDPDLARALESQRWQECEELICAFEEAWLHDSSPRIRDFLVLESDVRLALLLELAHVDLEFRLKRGETARVESYLEAFPEIRDRSSAVLDLLTAERDLRRRLEGGDFRDDYQDRFPALAEALADRFSRADSIDGKSELPALDGTHEAPGYQILSEIGRGGMGVVYKAHDPALERSVAIKFVPSEYAADKERFARFQREARTASALNHPNICTVHALGEHQGRPFLVMEFVEGRTLRRARGSQAEILDWLAQTARALDAAHAAGVVHRDVKPENLMLRDDGYIKVLDFGLARRLPKSNEQLLRETGDQALVGTVAYMSPEQTNGGAAESASDIFSLGVVAYELLTGRHPFDAGTPLATLLAIAQASPTPPARVQPEIPLPLSNLIEAMLHKDPRLRPTSAEVEAGLLACGACAPGSAESAPKSTQRPIVRRQQELAVLRAALVDADAGRGSFVCLAGEPGIGKTTLAEDFLQEAASQRPSRLVVCGHCSERLAETEAYLPILDALENLLRGEPNGRIARLLKVTAPAWFGQLSPAARGGEAQAEGAPQAGSQSAMLREFSTFLVEAARRATVVLFIDDLHWADLSTVDLLATISRNVSSMRLLVVLAYRPTELLLHRHPFRNVKQDLLRRGVGAEWTLSFLDRRDVTRYLDLAFPGHAFPEELAERIHARTEGSPLFMADLLRYLRDRGVLAEVDGRWTATGPLPDFSREMPESVRVLIERHLEGLDPDDLQLLSAAAVQGYEFDSLILADALDREPADVEERLQSLARTHGLVRLVRQQELPPSRVSLRYAFVHILYQQALYQDLSPSRRVAFSLSLAEALASCHGGDEGNSAVTAELACLYEVGRDYLRAAEYLWRASRHAGRVYAHGEAVALALRGINLLARLPDSTERTDLERRLQTMVGLQVQVTQGYAAPAARAAYLRALALCDEETNVASRFLIVWGLWLVNKVRSELAEAEARAGELLELAGRSGSYDLELQAHQALGMTAFCQGRPETVLRHVEATVALYDPVRHLGHASQYGQDPAVTTQAFGAVALWILGYPDTSLRQVEEVLRMPGARSPTSRAISLHFAAMTHQLRREASKALDFADRSAAVSDENRLSYFSAGGVVLQGWAMAALGRREQGVAQLRRGLVAWQATGSLTYYTYFLGLLADALGASPESFAVLAEALELVEKTGERLFEAELHRLWGELLVRDNASGEARNQARSRFERAAEIARRQRARSFELRARTSLARLGPPDGDSAARLALRQLYETFTEGFDTPDLRAAAALLDTRQGSAP